MYTEGRQQGPKPFLPAESETVKPLEDTELPLVLFTPPPAHLPLLQIS